MASLIAITDLKGKSLIQRSYRDDVPPSAIERFVPLLSEMEEENQFVTPCLRVKESITCILGITIFTVLTEYFKELEVEAVGDNFVIIYEESHKLEIQQVPVPVSVTSAVSWSSEGARYQKNEVFLDVIERVNLLVTAQFKQRSTANNVEVHIPVPDDADTPRFRERYNTYLKSRLCMEDQAVGRNKEFLMRAHFGLPSVNGEDLENRAPISVKFEIPYFTVSGIQVRYLKIFEKSGYQALPTNQSREQAAVVETF
ncbi:hypothetical protein BT69DRAFT_1297614 [Atractiella rhizophila]|nr:hypothetical protein BT69DRAFT_1297614 [Atractiella rhizophila]